jgi:hypothetical protein
MTIFGKTASEYVAFTRPWVVLILVAGIARLALSLADVPNSTTKWISMSAVMGVGLIYYAVRTYTSGFGSYKQLLGVVAVPNLAAQTISMVAIAIAIFTGTGNVFTAPEYGFGSDGKTWTHFAAHLFIGTTAGTVSSWLFGCLVMFISKKLSARDRGTRAAVRA